MKGVNNMLKKIKENWGIIVVAIFTLITILVNVIMHMTDDHDTSISVESLVSIMNFLLPIIVMVYIAWKVVTKHPIVSSATSTIETTTEVIEKVKKVKDVHKIIKMPNFSKTKEVISKVKDFKIPKFDIKKVDFKSLVSGAKNWFKKKK
jgi:amino acid permease